jgi:hypothetical protein
MSAKMRVMAAYLKKIAVKLDTEAETEEMPDSPEQAKWRRLLMRLQGKDVLGKLQVMIAKPRQMKSDLYLARLMDKMEDAGDGPMNVQQLMKAIKLIFIRKLAVAPFLKKVLDYGVDNGYMALLRVLSKNRAKFTLAKDAPESAE